jgi:2-isopropylmalate synthase
VVQASVEASRIYSKSALGVGSLKGGNGLSIVGRRISTASLCGSCRLSDIERAWDAVKHAKHPRVHVFIATSEIHMKHKLRMSREQVSCL